MTRQAASAPRGAVATRANPVLTVRDARKSFRGGAPWHRRTTEVLRGASLQVGPGELVGLVGENGSGKSTLMQIVVGLLASDGGEVRRPARFGYCPQQTVLWDKLTVVEHFQLFAAAYGLDDDQGAAASASLLEELQFERYREFRVEELSGGTRQKLNLALALMHDPELLLLDECLDEAAQILEELPPRLRQVAYLQASGLHYSEIADFTGDSLSRVSALVRRANEPRGWLCRARARRPARLASAPALARHGETGQPAVVVDRHGGSSPRQSTCGVADSTTPAPALAPRRATAVERSRVPAGATQAEVAPSVRRGHGRLPRATSSS